MSESRAEKTTWRSWAATALNEANQGDLEESNTKRLFALTEMLTACIVMYCEPGEARKEALDQVVSAYGAASAVVDPRPRVEA